MEPVSGALGWRFGVADIGGHFAEGGGLVGAGVGGFAGEGEVGDGG